VLAGVALRFVTRSELWLDEALTVNISNLPLGDSAAALKTGRRTAALLRRSTAG
jgi:hypothetical protein